MEMNVNLSGNTPTQEEMRMFAMAIVNKLYYLNTPGYWEEVEKVMAYLSDGKLPSEEVNLQVV